MDRLTELPAISGDSEETTDVCTHKELTLKEKRNGLMCYIDNTMEFLAEICQALALHY